jgi:hypothetical protein
MKIPAHYLFACLLIIGLTACSKKDGTATTVTPAAAEATPPAAVAPDATGAAPQAAVSANVGQLESNVGAALKQQDYDAAVNALAQVSSAQPSMSDAQRLQYAQQLQSTLAALSAAKETNPRAKAAYERLGRIATGR